MCYLCKICIFSISKNNHNNEVYFNVNLKLCIENRGYICDVVVGIFFKCNKSNRRILLYNRIYVFEL